MNNPNPFVPKGSLQELQNKRRTHLKLGVLCVLTVSVAGLMVMLIQGCKQKAATDDNALAPVDTNAIPVVDTNPPAIDTNIPPATFNSNTVVGVPQTTPVAQVPIPPVNPVTTPSVPPDQGNVGGGEYTVVKGDSLAKIAKKNGVTLKALEAANPEVKPTKLKIGQKLVLPGGSKPADGTSATGAGAAPVTEAETYTVKSGDTLTKIAKAHHVKLKELQAANGLTTTKIKVGEKLKIPAKAEAAAPLAAPATEINPAPATSAPPVPVVTPASNSPAPAAPGQH